MSSAPAWISCLNTIRFCTCSPVATFTGATDWRMTRVAEDVVRAGGLLDPVRVEALQLPDPGDGLRHVPPLVGVDGDAHVGADRFARRRHAPDVVGQVGADLQLDLGEAVRYGLLGQPGQLLVRVAEPAGRGRVGRVAALAKLRRPLGWRLPCRVGSRSTASS